MRPRSLILCGFVLLLSLAASAARLRQIALLDIPGRPGFDTLAFAGGKLVIAHNGAGTVDIFDPVRRRFVAHVDGIAEARGIAVDETGDRVFIADAANRNVSVINTKEWKVTGNIPLTQSPDALAYLSRERLLVVAQPLAQSLAMVNADNGKPVDTIQLAGRPDHFAVDSQRGLLYVSLQDRNQIAVYSTADASAAPKLVQTFSLNASQPTGMVLDPQSKRLFVAVRYAVLALDTERGAELARVPVAGGTDTLWFDQADQQLFAAASDGTVAGIDISGGKLAYGYEVRTDVRGHTLAFDPEKKLIYVPGGREGKSKLVILKPFGMAEAADDNQTRTAQVSPK
jgi:DNA-binding beta-propeller fold protein YncE